MHNTICFLDRFGYIKWDPIPTGTHTIQVDYEGATINLTTRDYPPFPPEHWGMPKTCSLQNEAMFYGCVCILSPVPLEEGEFILYEVGRMTADITRVNVRLKGFIEAPG